MGTSKIVDTFGSAKIPMALPWLRDASVQVAIIGVVGTITAALVLRPWQPDKDDGRSEAVMMYSAGTRVIVTELNDYMGFYPRSLEAMIDSGFTDSIANAILRKRLFTERIYRQAKIDTTSTKLRLVFPDFQYNGMDWKQIHKNSERLYGRFFDALLASHKAGQNPQANDKVQEAFNEYIEFRTEIRDACLEAISK
jgi:hypothetical protein